MSSNIVIFLFAEPCIVNANDIRERNIRFKYGRQEKIYAPHNDGIEYACISGRPYGRYVNMKRYCSDGVMHLPLCL